ncbi:hypothetical protein D9611_012031 [Ephemerocybe angulata]|uniref:AB hydrolase-1 domain-containing protein n=1 Tax=Ephemerocybe angulata TaxID=980116 RepID=A0A8H5ASM0_9AGAR|nr:hypothetical protein D9611_012031 [Tulosesus angulatus]
MASLRPLQSISVGNDGTQLGYLDSGAPTTTDYTTIFTVHGTAFTSCKVLNIAPTHGVRVVSINRRDYPGSSPLSQQNIATLAGGTNQERDEHLSARGLEILAFIDNLLNEKHFQLSHDGNTGGLALLGWSLGVSHVLAAVANAQLLGGAAQQRFTIEGANPRRPYFSLSCRGIQMLWDTPKLALEVFKWALESWADGLERSSTLTIPVSER